jgi:gamma-glutamyltranspeptidase/glutathione hydrolase
VASGDNSSKLRNNVKEYLLATQSHAFEVPSMHEEYSVRRAVAGTSCMVSTGHHLATLAGLQIFRDGGNAIDAAIAAGAVAAVVLPHACGVGGDCFAIGYDAKTARTWVLNGSGKSPDLISPSTFLDRIPEEGVAAATVPGIVHGWSELLKRYGTRTLRQVLLPATEHAAKGFPINDILAKLIVDNQAKLQKHPYSAATLIPSGKPLQKGEMLRQPSLAKTLEQIVAGGAEQFYEGEIASEICRYVETVGGFLRPRDFSTHSSRWEIEIPTVSYHGYQVIVPPPNSLATLLLAQLKLLSHSGLEGASHNSPDYIERLLKAKRRAFRGVLPLIGDPETSGVSISDLLSDAFIEQLSKTELPRREDAGQEISDTTVIVTADSAGNCITLIQSLFFHFGCGAIAGDTGVFLNNRMTGFTLSPNEPNSLAGGKRPAHTLSPALVLKNDRPFLAIAAPGAYGQTQTLCQVLNNILAFDMEPQVALEVPRWLDDLDETVLMESRMDPGVANSLKRRGFKLQVGSPWEPKTGSVQCVLMREQSGGLLLYGAADPRRLGVALGW